MLSFIYQNSTLEPHLNRFLICPQKELDATAAALPTDRMKASSPGKNSSTKAASSRRILQRWAKARNGVRDDFPNDRKLKGSGAKENWAHNCHMSGLAHPGLMGTVKHHVSAIQISWILLLAFCLHFDCLQDSNAHPRSPCRVAFLLLGLFHLSSSAWPCL